MRLSYYTELGAYSTGGTHSIVDASTPSGAQGAYRVRNLEWTTYGVFTNKVPVGPYRGYGQHATAIGSSDPIAVTASTPPPTSSSGSWT